jgi:PII-like signaling protein
LQRADRETLNELHAARCCSINGPRQNPAALENVDAGGKINSFLPVLDKMMGGGLLTMKNVKPIEYRAGKEIGETA